MTESQQLIAELKTQLKLRGVHYADIATALDLSEGSVKRLLAEGNNISLERLERICQLIDLEMSELFKLAYAQKHGLMTLSYQQEKELIDDKALLLVAVCVVNGYTFKQIAEQYQFNEPDLIQKCVQLDRLGIIELQPNNRFKLKVAKQFTWIAGGPIQSFFQQQVQHAFFNSYFAAEDEKLVMATGLMSLPSNQKMQQKMQKLVGEFYATCQSDNELDIKDRHGTSLVLAIRRWTFPLFAEREKEVTQRKK
ncbi:helix-turn-helix transcriptional regulator [Vibrio cidicii]|uniref:helix-turn-helix domain-containing protein n=1 Tax=Vibrio cidicii TaxID=1763883 RepID=UPI003753246D